MSDFQVRKAKQEDLAILLEFEQGIIGAERPMDPTLAVDPISYYDISDLINSEDAEVIVVEVDAVIIASGYAKIKKALPYLNHEFYSYLGFMYTHPDFRGKGVNKLIVDELRKWSFLKGLKEIRLTVYDENPGAIRAYEKVGFKKHLIEMRLTDFDDS
ncbi:MAG: GNAT family N-acetyltransferase [Maribacter sp.]